MSISLKSTILLIFLGISAACTQAVSSYTLNTENKNQLEIITNQKKIPFIVEMATTDSEQQKGLMNRTSIPENTGMLFVMKQDQIIKMWMKDTLIPLDMLFIDHSGKIIFIAHSTTPLSLDTIGIDQPTLAVLEIAGGVANAQNINVGDRVVHPAFKP